MKGASENHSTHRLVLLSCPIDISRLTYPLFCGFHFLAFIFIPTLTVFQCNPPAVGFPEWLLRTLGSGASCSSQRTCRERTFSRYVTETVAAELRMTQQANLYKPTPTF